MTAPTDSGEQRGLSIMVRKLGLVGTGYHWHFIGVFVVLFGLQDQQKYWLLSYFEMRLIRPQRVVEQFTAAWSPHFTLDVLRDQFSIKCGCSGR
jgi:hypothetical protein